MDGTGEHCSKNAHFAEQAIVPQVKVEKIPLKDHTKLRKRLKLYYRLKRDLSPQAIRRYQQQEIKRKIKALIPEFVKKWLRKLKAL